MESIKDKIPAMLVTVRINSSPLGSRHTLKAYGSHVARMSIMTTLLAILGVRGNRAVTHLLSGSVAIVSSIVLRILIQAVRRSISETTKGLDLSSNMILNHITTVSLKKLILGWFEGPKLRQRTEYWHLPTRGVITALAALVEGLAVLAGERPPAWCP